jgi:hypothetical protein
VLALGGCVMADRKVRGSTFDTSTVVAAATPLMALSRVYGPCRKK